MVEDQESTGQAHEMLLQDIFQIAEVVVVVVEVLVVTEGELVAVVVVPAAAAVSRLD